MIKAVVFDYDWVLNRYYFRPQHDLFDLAKELRARGIKTAVLSNRFFPFTLLATFHGELKSFEPVVWARSAGGAKPNPQCYKSIIKKLGLKPEECLFIDNRAGNVSGAEATGMKAILAHDTKHTVASIKQMVKFI